MIFCSFDFLCLQKKKVGAKRNPAPFSKRKICPRGRRAGALYLNMEGSAQPSTRFDPNWHSHPVSAFPNTLQTKLHLTSRILSVQAAGFLQFPLNTPQAIHRDQSKIQRKCTFLLIDLTNTNQLLLSFRLCTEGVNVHETWACSQVAHHTRGLGGRERNEPLKLLCKNSFFTVFCLQSVHGEFEVTEP